MMEAMGLKKRTQIRCFYLINHLNAALQMPGTWSDVSCLSDSSS